MTNDTNGNTDIFVHDRQTGETTRISVANDGSEGDENSTTPSISADGRFVSFYSRSSNLAGDTSHGQIFVHDRQTSETTRISIARDIFVSDRQTGETTRISLSKDGINVNSTGSPSISANGRYIIFGTDASYFVNDPNSFESEIFLHDRQTGETTPVSVNSDGILASFFSYAYTASISADGRYIAFSTKASNLVASDTNDESDVFVHDRQTGETTRVSVASDGSEGYGKSANPSISSDGRFVSFNSWSSNLVADDSNHLRDIFVHDRQTGETTRVSITSNGIPRGDSLPSSTQSISADGQFIAFRSSATNLVPGDTNNNVDIFVHDRLADTTPPPPTATPANLTLSATINGNDTLPKPGPALPNSGSPANWQYSITNTGDETASRVRLYAKQLQPVHDSKWTLLCALGNITGSNAASCSSNSLIAAGPSKVLLSAQGLDKNGDRLIVGTAAWYVGGTDTSAPALSLQVLLNGADDDNAAPGVSLTANDTLTYTYSVTNTGPFTLKKVRVFDRERSPVKGKWSRACIFDTLVPAETVSCTRTLTAGTGAIRRDVSVQSFYQSQRIKDDEASFYTGQ